LYINGTLIPFFALELAKDGHIVLCPELRDIYRAFGGDGGIELIVTPSNPHEMDIPQLLKFLGDGS
jgi:hypothetical protein